jgi:hypothetical protein
VDDIYEGNPFLKMTPVQIALAPWIELDPLGEGNRDAAQTVSPSQVHENGKCFFDCLGGVARWTPHPGFVSRQGI